MKNSLRLTAMVGILGLTAWLSAENTAEAVGPYPDCTTVHRTSCTTAGTYKTCWRSSAQETNVCRCEGTPLAWNCNW
jgi:hypothetical protein